MCNMGAGFVVCFSTTACFSFLFGVMFPWKIFKGSCFGLSLEHDCTLFTLVFTKLHYIQTK